MMGMLSLICAAGFKMHLKLFFLFFLQHQPLLAFVADLKLFDFDDIRLEVFFVAPFPQLTSYAI